MKILDQLEHDITHDCLQPGDARKALPTLIRVADYFCLVGDFMWDRGPPIPSYVKRTLEIGTQPVGAVLVPGSEREEKANLPEEEPMRVEFTSVVGNVVGVPDEGSVNSIYLHALKGKRVKVTAEELP